MQDILKRAGLDNIMRIYRSEAEMTADSKEIMRQTSTYRVGEEPPGPGAFPGVPAEPAAPKTEFDDFRSAMGEQLRQKATAVILRALELDRDAPRAVR
mgnify:CR=1 FL=1